MKKNLLNSFVTGVITSSLIFSPTSFAKAVDPTVNPKVDEFKKVLNESKLESVKSYSELWQRIQKSNLTAGQTSSIRYMLTALNGQKFPEMKFQEFKYKGKSAIKMITTVQEEQVVVEYLFSNNEAIKINGVVLTNEDLQSNAKIQQKLAPLSFVKKGYAALKKDVFSRSFIPDQKTWSKLTTYQKADYLLRFRELLQAAYKVYDQSPYKVVAQRSPSSENFIQLLLSSEELVAAESGEIGTKNAKAKPGSPAIQAAGDDAAETVKKLEKTRFLGKDDVDGTRKGPSCIIAGYAMEWSGNACKWNSRKAEVFNSPESKYCQKINKSKSWVACQPVAYIKGDGDPVCVDSSTQALQSATHPNGDCDKGSKLDTAQDKKNYIDGWLKKIDKKYTKTKDGKDLVEVRGDKLFTNDKELYNKITGELIKPLSSYIQSAYSVCTATDDTNSKFRYKHEDRKSSAKAKPAKKSKSAKTGVLTPLDADETHDDAYQNEACDGLLKRALAIKDLFEPITESGTAITSDDCKDWTPAGSAISDKGTCICDMKKGYRLETSIPPKPKTCVSTGGNSQSNEPPPVAAGVATEEAERNVASDECPANPSMFQRFNPFSNCKMTGTDWFMGGLFAFTLLCIAENQKKMNMGGIMGICDKNDKKSSGGGGYVDPVNPGLPTTTTTTTTTTTPTTAPRDSEGGTINTNPDGAAGSVR